MTVSKRNGLICIGALGTFVLIALLALDGNASMFVDGEPVTGLAGAGYAVGGACIGLIAAFFGLVLAAVVLTSVSFFVFVVLATVFLMVLVLLSPLFLPVVFVAALIWFFGRKKATAAA
ncbi:type IV secretory pathway VirB6-like protein [Oxalobacteraceae bacterium GrIS 2.11]